MTDPCQLMHEIEKIFPDYKKMKSEYYKQVTLFNNQRKLVFKNLNDTKRLHKRSENKWIELSKHKKYLPVVVTRKIQFIGSEFWLKTLLTYLVDKYKLFNMEIHNVNANLLILSDICVKFDIPFNFPENRNKIQLQKSECTHCNKSILLCDEHQTTLQYQKEYIHPQIDLLPRDTIVAIDVESANIKHKQIGLPDKHALRVAAVAYMYNERRRMKFPTLIYHSFWCPAVAITTYTPVLGLSVKEIYANLNKFADRSNAKQTFVDKIVKDHTLVFVNANEDITALELSPFLNIRDIQSYFVRNQDNLQQPEPVNLKWLSKYVLEKEIQENAKKITHCPVVDAECTLKLYLLIPKGLWVKLPFESKDFSIAPTHTSSYVTNYHDFNFESDMETESYDSDVELVEKMYSTQQVASPMNRPKSESINCFTDDFMPDYKPMTQLLKKDSVLINKNVIWTDDCNNAFIELKECLISSPILAHFQTGKPLILYTDACGYASGWCLHQLQDGKERVLVYGSMMFNETQQKYCVTDQECLAMVTAIIKLRHFLAGVHFIVKVDHHALCWLMRVKDIAGRLGRYALRLQEMDFEIQYKSGKTHQNSDCMSRYPALELNPKDIEEEVDIPVYCQSIKKTCNKVTCLLTSPIQPDYKIVKNKHIVTIPGLELDWVEDVYMECNNSNGEQLFLPAEITPSPELVVYNIESLKMDVEQSKDKWVKWIKDNLECQESKAHDRYKVINNILYRKTHNDHGEDVNLLCLPSHLRSDVLQDLHGTLTGGHFGYFKTASKVRHRFYWPGRDKDVAKFVRSCSCCQFRKIETALPKGLLKPISVTKPFDLIGLDLVGPLPKSNDMRYLLVCVDYATRLTIISALKESKSEDIADFFITKIICKHGCPRRLLTDRGRQFISNAMEDVLKFFKTDHSLCAAYKPNTQGLVERTNRTLMDSISMYCNSNQRNWSKVVPFIEFAFNSSINKSTGFSPFFALHGFEPTLPTDVAMKLTIDDNVQYTSDKLHDARELLKENLREAQFEQKLYYDKRHRFVEFKVGDAVGVYKKVRKVGVNEKMMFKYSGPYRITKVYTVPHNTYEIEEYSNPTTRENIPLMRLKKWYLRNNSSNKKIADSSHDQNSKPDEMNNEPLSAKVDVLYTDSLFEDKRSRRSKVRHLKKMIGSNSVQGANSNRYYREDSRLEEAMSHSPSGNSLLRKASIGMGHLKEYFDGSTVSNEETDPTKETPPDSG